MDLNRRAFLGGLGATFAVRSVLAAAKRLETPRLRVGIVSDVHAQHAYDPNDEKHQGYFSTGTLEKALAYFKEQGVDAVVIAGDMTQFGGLCELEATGISWRRAFAEKYYCADECIPKTGLVCFAESEFPAGAKVRFAVRAMNDWGKRSGPIYGEILT